MTSDADTETIAARMTCDSDVELARLLATHAGVILLRLRTRKRVPASRLKDDGDRRSHDFLTAALAKLRPGDAVLSEEGADDHARLEARRVWIVDPLDGTREYSELDRDDWAIHVALWEDGELTAGAVALPGLGPTLTSELSPRPRPAAPQPRILVSRSRPPAYAETVAEKLGAELVPMGSAGAKAMAVVRGQAEAYLHDGGQYEWDSAAPVVVARAAGLHTSRVDGSPLRYNNANPYQPDLLICRPELADPILQAIATAK
ncbi:3'(2'),5'-bisphosphate nucleotidase CysQ [Cryptosporangium japonicum]|uniref:3'(2'),5-bisphosphonucleoside 3'(2')-phosphohydrolase n=2 Tax=Cryptosporangium japonicum TaxID=80872 RepID=A0ABP3EBF4_9ACTN